MSNQPPTLNYQTPPKRSRWFAGRLGLILLVLCAIIALLSSWQLQRAHHAARLARQAQLRQLVIVRSKSLSAKSAPAQLGQTTDNREDSAEAAVINRKW